MVHHTCNEDSKTTRMYRLQGSSWAVNTRGQTLSIPPSCKVSMSPLYSLQKLSVFVSMSFVNLSLHYSYWRQNNGIVEDPRHAPYDWCLKCVILENWTLSCTGCSCSMCRVRTRTSHPLLGLALCVVGNYFTDVRINRKVVGMQKVLFPNIFPNITAFPSYINFFWFGNYIQWCSGILD